MSTSVAAMRLWNLKKIGLAGYPVRQAGHPAALTAAVTSQDQRFMVTAGGRTAWLWDLTKPPPRARSATLDHPAAVSATAISKDG
ncbi:MAG: hypothetical protein GY953_47590 [bacterium]|nr:hypothetical protein [bacterium]